MSKLESLESAISGHDSVRLCERAERYPGLLIRNNGGTAEIALHGAQVIQFTPKDKHALLWLSEDALYQSGKAIRGGIPICWPWFGNHTTNASLPAHGFVRNRFWTLSTIVEPSDSETRITLTTRSDESSMALWPHRFELELTIIVSTSLTLELKMTNTDRQPWTCGGALHSYFAVGNIENTRIESVTGSEYLDKPDDFARKTQTGPLTFVGEVDRVFIGFENDCVISDIANQREIRVKKAGSQTTVIWNPWRDIATAMNDMPDDGYRRFVCVEPANAFDDLVTLAPGESHVLATTISQSDQ